jgi:hypothetical protein
MKEESKFNAAMDSIWFDGHVARPFESKYKSIFVNFDPQKLHESAITDHLIESYGKEVFLLLNKSLSFCAGWFTESESADLRYERPIDNFGIIRLANFAHALFFYENRVIDDDLPRRSFNEIRDSEDWRHYLTIISDGYDSSLEKKDYEPSQLIGICTLFMVDRACSEITASGFNKDTISLLLTAHRFLQAAEISVGEFSAEGLIKNANSELARKRAMIRHKNDPKQADRNFVFDCWKKWRKKPEAYKGKAAFARDMLDKCENLESQKVIEDWCRRWEMEHKL